MMNGRSKSTLFLMEQLIVIGTFALCAAACIRILVSAYFMAVEAKDITNGIRVAESGAECYKAVSGDLVRVAQILGGTAADTDAAAVAVVYYDKNWKVCSQDDENAKYALRLVSGGTDMGESKLVQGELLVERLTGEQIIAFPIAVMGAALGGAG